MKQAIKIYLLSPVFVFSFACKKFVDIPFPIDKVGDEKLFRSDELATAAVIGIYSRMLQSMGASLTTGSLSSFGAMSADEGRAFYTMEENEQFQKNTLSVENASILNMWSDAYNKIYHANKCVEGLQKSDAITPTLKNQLLGELFVVRSLYYFYLLNLWGNVPFTTTSDYTANAQIPRAGTEIIYDSITRDLITAKDLLKEQYPGSSRSRPNKWTASALLSRIYLYRQKWAEAATEATGIIESGVYDLPSPETVFTNNSTEAIWHLESNSFTGAVPEALSFVPMYGYIPFVIHDELAESFDDSDTRRQLWIGIIEDAGVPYYHAFKYRVVEKDPSRKENYVLFRLAEQLLIRAEAHAELNKAGEALNDLNKVRSRANLDDVENITDKDEIIDLIITERRKEFFCEMGHRWLDIKRRKLGTEILAPLKPGWNSKKELFPIPLTNILANPALTQNEGYIN
jgi:starch-binding outer membrane protein, SusD/RagB family